MVGRPVLDPQRVVLDEMLRLMNYRANWFGFRVRAIRNPIV
jgi:hypothetical protein